MLFIECREISFIWKFVEFVHNEISDGWSGQGRGTFFKSGGLGLMVDYLRGGGGGGGGSPLKFWNTRFRDNGWTKRYTQWANFLVGFVAQKPYGAAVVAYARLRGQFWPITWPNIDIFQWNQLYSIDSVNLRIVCKFRPNNFKIFGAKIFWRPKSKFCQ